MKRLITSILDTASNPDNIECIFYIDQDDNSYNTGGKRPVSILTERTHRGGVWAHWITGSRIVLSEMWNVCYKHAKGPYYMHCGDDLIFRTEDWDTKLIAGFDPYPDKIAFVFADDGSDWGKTMGTHGVLHKNWVDTVGYFVPPYFSSDYNDTWLNDVAEMIGRKVFVPGVYNEHMHYSFGKAELDQTHAERLERHARDNVAQIYEDMLPQRQEDAQKLRAFIRNYNEHS
ncbi:MAG TPA: hypothetical protein VJ742_12040 [Nitrososphaera sp.]|nr:hypothetical protein [Nitrososphaera sp.]